MNLPNEFIYAAARAERIAYVRSFTNLHKSGIRRVKLWFLWGDFRPSMFVEFKKVIEAAFPGCIVKFFPRTGPIAANIQVWL